MESYNPNEGMPKQMGEKFEKKYEGMEPHITEEELREECADYPELLPLLDEMVEYASRYVLDVWKMEALLRKQKEFTSAEEWKEAWSKVDGDRSRLHDTFIDSIAILSRNMNQRELNTDWVKELAPTGKLERARCGKFGIMLMFRRYINFKLSSEDSHETD